MNVCLKTSTKLHNNIAIIDNYHCHLFFVCVLLFVFCVLFFDKTFFKVIYPHPDHTLSSAVCLASRDLLSLEITNSHVSLSLYSPLLSTLETSEIFHQ